MFTFILIVFVLIDILIFLKIDFNRNLEKSIIYRFLEYLYKRLELYKD